MNEPQNEARWLTVGLSTGLRTGTPAGVVADRLEVVLFRDSDGVARALLDQCVHRRALLSHGTVTPAGLIECPYHGWRYSGRDGQCVAIPNLAADEKVPKAYRVPTFAIQEKDGFISIWTGDGNALDTPLPDLAIPDFGSIAEGTGLISFPFSGCADLLLDAPGGFLDIPGVTIVNDHRFGDPVIEKDKVTALYGALWSRRRGKTVVADYPLMLRVTATLDGGWAWVELLDDRHTVLSASVLALLPVKSTLCAVSWRSVATDTARPLFIRSRATIEAGTVRAAIDYVSRLRTRHVDKMREDGVAA